MVDFQVIIDEIKHIEKVMNSYNEKISQLIDEMEDYRLEVEKEKESLNERRSKKLKAIYEIINEN